MRDNDVDCSFCYFEDLSFCFADDSSYIVDVVSNRDISEFDAVYLRRWTDVDAKAMAVAIYLKVKGVKFFDTEAYYQSSKSKLSQYAKLWENALPIPRTQLAPKDYLLKTANSLNYPLVVKDASGTRGETNFKADNPKELIKVLTDHSNVDFLVQTYIPNNFDYRVLVLGNEIKLVIKRIATGNYKNNISQGATAEMVGVNVLTNAQIDDSIKASKVFNRDVAGVDLVVSSETGKHYFFEVNRSPQIESSSYEKEKAKVLAEYIRSIR